MHTGAWAGELEGRLPFGFTNDLFNFIFLLYRGNTQGQILRTFSQIVSIDIKVAIKFL